MHYYSTGLRYERTSWKSQRGMWRNPSIHKHGCRNLGSCDQKTIGKRPCKYLSALCCQMIKKSDYDMTWTEPTYRFLFRRWTTPLNAPVRDGFRFLSGTFWIKRHLYLNLQMLTPSYHEMQRIYNKTSSSVSWNDQPLILKQTDFSRMYPSVLRILCSQATSTHVEWSNLRYICFLVMLWFWTLL